jgi:hypothetical protein
LPSADARKLLDRLEAILSLISKYWGLPPQGEIECYVVRNLDAWPPDSLSGMGRAKIAVGSGITFTETINRGKQFLSGKSIVYAAADTGTPEHEIVHAYCGQTFGRTGPLWYSEGMAELGQFWQAGRGDVRVKQHMIDYLRKQAPESVAQIVAADAADGDTSGTARTGDSWQAYAARWALCHLLVHNPNYAPRFRTLGLGYLNGAKASFREAFGAQQDELEFEYRQFLQNLTQGYRVDLCKWDWHRKFRELSTAPLSAKVIANRGWQAAGALVSAVASYEFSATGTWHLGETAPDVTAAGLPGGRGQLEAVVFHDFELSEPFLLGAGGTFSPPRDGQLFLRCREPWNELADNTGFVTVKLRKSSNEKTPESAGTATLKRPAPSQ